MRGLRVRGAEVGDRLWRLQLEASQGEASLAARGVGANRGEPSRVLIIRPSALGDVCRSVAVLASLRAAYPRAAIDWLVQDGFADAVRHHPMLTRVVEFPRGPISASLKRLRVEPLREFLRGLREASYDLVIDAQGLGRSGFFAWATRAGRRVGDRHARECGWLGYNERHEIDPPPQQLHAVDRMLRLVERAGVKPMRDMRLYTSQADRDWLLADLRLRAGRFAVVAPTSRWEGKRWGIERYSALTRWMLERDVVDCVAVVGAQSEREQCGELLELASREARVVDLVGRTSVGRLMAVIEASGLVVANDSAALHMAVGFDRAYVALYGPTKVGLVGPYVGPREPVGVSGGVVLQDVAAGEPLDHKDAERGRAMMSRISVEMAKEAVERVVGVRRG